MSNWLAVVEECVMTKGTLFRLHRYAGLVMAASLLMQAVTGAMLIYRVNIARWIDPAGMIRQSARGTAPVSQALASAQRQFSGFVVKRIFAPDRPEGAYFVELADRTGADRYASVDPGDGRVLRSGTLAAFPMEAALRLHYQLMLGQTGSMLIFINACALVFLLFTGLGYWWPKSGRIGRGLAVKWSQPGRLVLRQLHRTFGVMVSVLLLIVSVTGLLLAGPEALEAEPKLMPPRAVPLDRLDEAVVIAQSRFPGEELRDVRLSADNIRVNFHAPEQGPRAVHQATVDLATMAVISAAAPDNRALWMKILPIHTGDVAGAIGRALFALAAFALAALALTGPIMWWQQRKPRRSNL